MNPPARKSTDQIVLAGLFILLGALAAVFFFKWLGQPTSDRPRIEWSQPATSTQP